MSDGETRSIDADTLTRLAHLLERQDILDCLVRFSRGMDRFDRALFLSADVISTGWGGAGASGGSPCAATPSNGREWFPPCPFRLRMCRIATAMALRHATARIRAIGDR